MLCWLEWVFSDFPGFPNVTCLIYFIMKWKRRIVLLFNFLSSPSISGYWKHSCGRAGIHPLPPHRISSLWIGGNPLSREPGSPSVGWGGVHRRHRASINVLSSLTPKPGYGPANSRALVHVQPGGRLVLIDLCSLTCALWDRSWAQATWLAWFRSASWGPETIDFVVIRTHWYWTHDLSLIRAPFGPTGLTRNRFKTVSDRGL